MDQRTFLTNLCENNKDATIIGSIGTISYDLGEIEHPDKILIKGAMGAALPCAVAYAKHVEWPVICVIGDGSLLMKLGSLSTYLKELPSNLKVIVIHNGCYRSCGGQSTNFDTVKDWVNSLPNVEVHEIRN